MSSQLSYQGENIHLFQRMNRCNNFSFQGLKGSVGEFYIFYYFKSIPLRKELVASITGVGLATEGITAAVRVTTWRATAHSGPGWT